MLQCCGSDGDQLTVLEFFAVGKTARALLCHAVKGGGRCQKRTYLQFSRFQWSQFLWPRFFIGYFTLPFYCQYSNTALFPDAFRHLLSKTPCSETEQTDFIQLLRPYGSTVRKSGKHPIPGDSFLAAGIFRRRFLVDIHADSRPFTQIQIAVPHLRHTAEYLMQSF